MKNHQFADISHHKGDLDHQKFANVGMRLLISKASDAYHMPDINGRYDFSLNRHHDARFVQNFVGARSVGLIAGHYHFGRLDRPRGSLSRVPEENLRIYMEALQRLPGDILYSANVHACGILDMEQPDSQINAAGLSKATVSSMVLAMVQMWASAFENVILYSGSWWTDKLMVKGDMEEIAKIASVWEPEYTTQFASSEGYITHPDGYSVNPAGENYIPSLPHGFTPEFATTSDINGKIFAHQYGLGLIPGINSRIDMNRTELDKSVLGDIFGQAMEVDPPGQEEIPADMEDRLFDIGDKANEILSLVVDGLKDLGVGDPIDEEPPVINPPEEPTEPDQPWLGWWLKDQEEWPTYVENAKVGYVWVKNEFPLQVINKSDMTFTPYESEELRGATNTNGKRIIVKPGYPIMVFAQGDEYSKSPSKTVRCFNSWPIRKDGTITRPKFDGGRVAFLVMREQTKDGIDLWNGIPGDEEAFVTLFLPLDAVSSIYDPVSGETFYPDQEPADV